MITINSSRSNTTNKQETCLESHAKNSQHRSSTQPAGVNRANKFDIIISIDLSKKLMLPCGDQVEIVLKMALGLSRLSLPDKDTAMGGHQHSNILGRSLLCCFRFLVSGPMHFLKDFRKKFSTAAILDDDSATSGRTIRYTCADWFKFYNDVYDWPLGIRAKVPVSYSFLARFSIYVKILRKFDTISPK